MGGGRKAGSDKHITCGWASRGQGVKGAGKGKVGVEEAGLHLVKICWFSAGTAVLCLRAPFSFFHRIIHPSPACWSTQRHTGSTWARTRWPAGGSGSCPRSRVGDSLAEEAYTDRRAPGKGRSARLSNLSQE